MFIKIKNNNKDMQELKFLRLVKFFLANPYQEVYLRELSKKLKISPFAIKKYCDILLKEKLINEERKANLRYFKPNTSNLFFKQLKVANNIYLIQKFGLIEFLKENVANVSSIILFGSIAKGEDDEKSDVDLLIIGKDSYLDLSKFEDELGKEITLHIFSWSEWNRKAKEDNPFYFEVISEGINLFGELPVVKWK